MSLQDLPEVLDGLTVKQREALDLIANGFTSKEAARELDVSPKIVDRRIDVVRRKLGDVSRAEAARIYRTVVTGGEPLPHCPSPLTGMVGDGPRVGHRTEEETLTFADAITFVDAAPWSGFGLGSVPEVKPTRLSTRNRLALMGVGSILIASVLLLVLGVANGLESLLGQ